jgi:hypothetical protein
MGLDEQLYPSTNSPLAVYAEGKVLGIERELRNLTLAGDSGSTDRQTRLLAEPFVEL